MNGNIFTCFSTGLGNERFNTFGFVPFICELEDTSLVTLFFVCFSIIYVFRVLLKFSDTRLIINRQEKIIFIFNVIIALVCVLFTIYLQ